MHDARRQRNAHHENASTRRPLAAQIRQTRTAHRLSFRILLGWPRRECRPAMHVVAGDGLEPLESFHFFRNRKPVIDTAQERDKTAEDKDSC